MSKVLVSGSLAYDRIMDFPGAFENHFVPEKLHNISVSFQVDTFEENFGGCSGNIAYTLALLGEQPAIIATGGSDFDKYAEHLKASGVNTDSIHVRQDDVTASAFIMTDQNDNQIAAYYPGAGGVSYGELVPTDGAKLAVIAAGNDEDIRSLAALYRKQSIPFIFDPGQRVTALTGSDLIEVLTGAAVLFCNDYELGLIVFKTGLSEQQLLERVPTIIATLGAKGTRIITVEGETKVDAVPVEKLVDPTGAGDAHRAGFAKGMLAGLPMNECVQFASAVAVYVVESYGTQNHRFTMEELKERYKKAYGTPLVLR
jgi:adenosine kinase